MTDAFDPGKWPAFMTVPEVATVLRVSKMTVYRMIHREDMSSIRVGRSFRIPALEVERVLKEGIPVGAQEG